MIAAPVKTLGAACCCVWLAGALSSDVLGGNKPVSTNVLNASNEKRLVVVGEHQGFPAGLRVNVHAVPGSGRLLLDITSVRFSSESELSLVKAFEWAFIYSKKDELKEDFVVSVEHEYSRAIEIDGPSMGAAFGIIILASITKRKILSDVTVTGMIGNNGEVHKIGFIDVKARAAKQLGINKLLIPAGQRPKESGVSFVEVKTMNDIVQQMLQPLE